MVRLFLLAATAASGVLAAPQAGGSSTSSGTPTSASTAIPSPTGSPDATLPSQSPVPPKQAWCPSNIFCAGALLQTVNIAQLYPDSKTFVDKPTIKSADQVATDFFHLYNNSQGEPVTYGLITNFVQSDFKGEGLELKPITIASTSPKALSASGIPDSLSRAWAGIVNGYWGSLIRETNRDVLCPNDPSGCESSLIPLNHTFVVPGGRFREQYYWDSFWILEGLLTSELYDVAKSTLQNFMDELDRFGFIPNGGRIYYLNRSQPPVFIHMLSRYVEVTKDTSILDRALPLAEKELTWWANNRTITITSPYTNKSYKVSHYAVNNTAPRPESYLEDYETANGVVGGNDNPGYTDQQKADLYAELASGAETGWDYSTRWTKDPFATVGDTTNQEPLLRGLNVRGTIPVDLNSILYGAEVRLAALYDRSSSGSKSKRALKHRASASSHRQSAEARKAAILDLMWDPEKLAFYDFISTSNSRSGFFSAAAFYPMWNDIWPKEVLADESKAQAMFASVGVVLAQYNGTFPATFVTSGAQWDAPNTWPPHQYIVMKALDNVPKNVSTKAYPSLSSDTTSWSLVPSNQLGLDQSQMPVQNLAAGGNAQGDSNWSNGTWSNGGAVPNGGEKWNKALLRGMANRYFTSVFCSWYSTGGSIPGMLNQLSPEELNATHSDPSSTGHMYEKFNLLDIDAAGSGGEYTVQAGFGWTNGVALWVADNFGEVIEAPKCPAISVQQASSKKRWGWGWSADEETTTYVGKRLKGRDGRYLVEATREQTAPKRK
ncbi:hypothetical protein FRC01_005758 [Tulasnella sp. 417]|nr:hypothetical protein FRC01_005758 [Tulasnella sp. 417]